MKQPEIFGKITAIASFTLKAGLVYRKIIFEREKYQSHQNVAWPNPNLSTSNKLKQFRQDFQQMKKTYNFVLMLNKLT